MAEEKPLIRQWNMLRTLSARSEGVTVKEMAVELATCEKTVRRYLQTFVQAGFPLQETTGPHGQKSWSLGQQAVHDGLSFSFDEAVSLYLGRRFLEPLAGTLFWEASQKAFRKIRSILGRQAIEYLERFAEVFHCTQIGTSDYTGQADTIDTLMVCIEEQKSAQIAYQSQHESKVAEYRIDPYGLAYHSGSLYLIGRSARRNAIRHWKVDRIEAIEPTGQKFRLPKDFDLEKHLGTSLGIFQGAGHHHVRVRFSREVARFVREKRWHPSERLTDNPDGSLGWEADLGDLTELRSWLLSFGRHAQVLEPVCLREAIRTEAVATAKLYS